MSISSQDRVKLLALARESLTACVKGSPAARIKDSGGILGEKRGCFITLTNAGQLRGCIGTFNPTGPLSEIIVEMARSAARDPRFTMNPVIPSELPHLKVEVSVLSALEKTDKPLELEVGKHGIYIVQGFNSGCFLPEVATDQGWDNEEFLSYCCAHKANLPADAWKDSRTSVYLFTSEKFSE